MKTFMAAAAAIALGTALASAQTPATTAQRQGQPVATNAAGKEVTLVGCIEFEQDYRNRMAAGRGGVLGSGVGASDEFVLTNVRPAAAEVGTSGRRGGGAGANTGTTPGAGGGVYTLTGPQEKNLKRDVGRQLEIVGTIENAGKTSTGADLTDISDLPRVLIATWHPVGDFCPAN